MANSRPEVTKPTYKSLMATWNWAVTSFRPGATIPELGPSRSQHNDQEL